MKIILLVQFIAHLFADFFLQSESLCLGKQRFNLKSRHIYIHTLIVLIVSFCFTFSYRFIFYSMLIAVAHFIIDALKCLIERYLIKKKNADETKLYSNYILFFFDQAIHLLLLFAIVCWYWEENHYIPEYLTILPFNYMLIIAGMLLCLKPANVIIRACLSSLNLYDQYMESGGEGDDTKKKGLEKAGRWIGSIERLLALILILLGQYTAIGFIIAAKSVLRFGDKELHKTEYVLIGTLLSFGIAIAIGISIQLINKTLPSIL